MTTLSPFPSTGNPPPQGHTVAELLEAYTRDYLPKKAPQTQYHEKLLYGWMAEELGAFPLADLSPLVLRSWFNSLASCYKPNTIRRYRTALSAALTVAVQDYKWISTHPLRRVAQPPAPPDRERCLEADQLANLLAACQYSRNPHLYLAVVLALNTGARKNEIMQRTWEDLDLERAVLRLRQTKNGTRRAVPLVGRALALLQQHAQHYGSSRWVFPRRDGQKPVFIDSAWRTACARMGLEDFHFHDLRHTAASYLAMSGATLREIAEILGHRSLTQTQKYTHLMEPHTRGVLTRMAAQFLEAPGAEPAQAPAPMVPASSPDTPATPSITPPMTLDLQILAAVRALAPLPASAIQVAGMLLLPLARVRDILQQWAHRGTLVRISKGYYRYRPGGTDTASIAPTRDVSRPPSPRDTRGDPAMTTLLIRTRHDGPLEATPQVAAPLAPAREPPTHPGGPRPTLATLLQSYERTYLCQLAASTRRHHAVVFRKLGRHYGDLPLTAITPAWLRQWQEAITPGHTGGTVRQYLVTLSGCLTWAVENGWLAENPMDKMRKPSAPPGRVRFLSAEEYHRLTDACQRSANAFLYLLVVLGVSTGCRRNELCRLRWPEVDLERGTVRLVTTKNKHPRAVPVTGVALDLLRAHAATQRSGVAWLFPRVDGQRPVLIEQAWRTARKRAGLVDFRFHDLRHTCASYLAMSGASLLDIAEVLGHRKLDMVKRYTHLTEGHTRGVLQRMTAQHLGGAKGASCLRPPPQEGAPHGEL